MRLGNQDDARAVENAQAIAGAGADELAVHARTKAHAYRPPAYWERIADIRRAVRIPVIANGEIWNRDDALRCQELSGCDALMLGRGLVADPGLALALRSPSQPALGWATLLPLIVEFWQLVCRHVEARHRAGRLKQWLNYLRRRYPEAEEAYQSLRTVNDARVVGEQLVRLAEGRGFEPRRGC